MKFDSKAACLFGGRIRALRAKRGLSQRDVAKHCGITQPTLSNYEAGTRDPTLQCTVRLATLFGTTIDRLIGVGDFDDR